MGDVKDILGMAILSLELGKVIMSQMRRYPKDVEEQHQAILSRWLSEKSRLIKIS